MAAPRRRRCPLSSAEQPKPTDADLPPEPAGTSETDQSLLDRIRQGQPIALRVVMERHWPTLVGYATSIVGDQDVAEDVVLEAFVQVWAKGPEWEPTGTPKAYLHRITRKLALNARRDRALRHERQAGAASIAPRPALRRPGEEIEAEALRAEIEAAIAGLAERRREIFLLSRFSGLTHQEIAKTMGLSPQTVSNQMSAALAQLRVALGHHLND